MEYPCQFCSREVTRRQQALECDICHKWQHRTCNTGITQFIYRVICREDYDYTFHCCECAEPVNLDDINEPEPEPQADPVPVFNRLNQLIPTRRVQGFCLDFEKGVWGALRSLYPDCVIKGCSFHWSQAVMRRLAKLGLKTAYDHDKAVHVFTRKLLALPYLPAAHITPAFQQLQQECVSANNQQLQQLVRYVNNTWIQGRVYAIHEWSVFMQTVRTNNDTEGWHNRLSSKSHGGKLHFYKLVPALLKEAKAVTRTLQLVEEQALTRRSSCKRNSQRLQTLWEDYQRKMMTTSSFLRAVGYLYTPAFPTPAETSDSD